MLQALKPLIAEGNLEERERLRCFVLDVIETSEPCIARDIATTDVAKQLLTQEEITDALSCTTESIPVPLAVVQKFALPDFSE